MLPYIIASPIVLILALVVIVAFFMTLHRRRGIAHAGTVPGQFPPDPLMPVGGIAVANKLNNTGAFSSTVFFTAPITGWYALGWGVRIQQTDAAGSITVTATPPHSVAIPGVQAAPATPSDGKSPIAPYYMGAGESLSIACAVSGLTGTTFDVWAFAQRLN